MFSKYWTRYVRLIEHAEKNVVQYYTIELSDVGMHDSVREDMTNSYTKAIKKFNSLASVYPRNFIKRDYEIK